MTNGPYETEAEAHADAAPLLAAIGLLERDSAAADDASQARGQYLMDAVAATGVEAGAFDRRIGAWLGESAEPETLAVVVGWIKRAHAAGCAEAELNLEPCGPTSTGAAPAELDAEFPDPEA